LILLDANLLLHITIENYPQHQAATDWFEQQVNGFVRIGMPWPSLLAFLRIGTNPRVYESPLSVNVAWAQIEAWLALQNTWIPQPTDQHQKVLSRLLSETQSTANLIPDAHLAALAIEHGLEICTSDTDFARFSGCKWRNPLSNPLNGSTS
jgi:uncharacterized protein